MLKKILITVGLAAIAFVAGAAIGFSLTTRTMVKSMFFLQEGEIYSLGQQAENAYFYEPNEISVWALKSFIKSFEEAASGRKIGEEGSAWVVLSPMDVIIAHARLGGVYHRMGKTDLALEQFKLAGEKSGKAFFQKMSKEEWLEWTAKWDKAMSKQTNPEIMQENE